MKYRAALVGLVILFSALAQAREPDSILIRNVKLIHRGGVVGDVVVSILIEGGKLKLVTEDAVPAEEAGLVLDAQEQVLLGKLALGDPPSFVILSEDPRENFEVLLDSAQYINFAVEKGAVVRNSLVATSEPEPVPEPEQSKWFAYDPPPVALPVTYHDTRKWNRFETRPINGLLTGALLLDRQRWGSQDEVSRSQVGDLDEFDGGEIRGFRLGLVGSLNFPRPWIYTVYAATNAYDKGFDSRTTDSGVFYDYRVDIPLFEKAGLSIGKQKEPISMERLLPLTFLPMQERSAAADALLPSRNIGLVLNGTGLDQRMTWAAGGFNNWLDSGESFEDNPRQYAARVTVVPWASADESNLFHFALAARYDDADLGLQYQTEPEFDQSPIFVDTGQFDADHATTYSFEASWRRGPFWLAYEYLNDDVNAQEVGDPDFDGYNVFASWAITGEMRSYNRRNGVFRPLPIARPVYGGGWGALEGVVRWSELDLTDGLIEGGEMDILSIGLNWWLTQVFSLGLNYRHIELDRFGEIGSSDGFSTRMTLILD